MKDIRFFILGPNAKLLQNKKLYWVPLKVLSDNPHLVLADMKQLSHNYKMHIITLFVFHGIHLRYINWTTSNASSLSVVREVLSVQPFYAIYSSTDKDRSHASLVHILLNPIHTVNCRNKIDRSSSNMSPELSTRLLTKPSYFDNFQLYCTFLYIKQFEKNFLVFYQSSFFLQTPSFTTPKYTRF